MTQPTEPLLGHASVNARDRHTVGNAIKNTSFAALFVYTYAESFYATKALVLVPSNTKKTG